MDAEIFKSSSTVCLPRLMTGPPEPCQAFRVKMRLWLRFNIRDGFPAVDESPGGRSARGIPVVRTRLSRNSKPLSQDGRHHEHLRRRQGCQGPQGTHRASVAPPSRSRLRHPSDGCRPGKIPPQQIKRTGFASLRGAVRTRGRRAGIHPSFLDPSARRICDLSGRSRPAVSRSRSRPRRGNRRADAFSPR